MKLKKWGNMAEFNEEKFKNLLHFIISECGHKSNVGKTVLFKLLYFSDFDFYEIYEEKMTGESYRKIENGPAPTHFDDAKDELIIEGLIEENESTGPYVPIKYTPLETPDMSSFTEKEIKVIRDVIRRYSDMRAGKISRHSHKDVPYIVTKCKDIIDYEFVFYRDEDFSVRDYDA